MIEFETLKESKKSNARLGVLKTPHGEVMTPALVPVATLAAVKALRSDEIAATGTQILISNTYHLHLQPGEKIVKAAGGINKFMNWPKPTMTDSGGFQVFSLGFGRDLGVGKKSIKYYPGKVERAIEKGNQPSNVKMTEEGVHFRSPMTGDELFLSPETSIAIQQQLGADIMYAFDECPPPGATHTYMKQSLARTHRWAKRSLDARASKQALYGIVQGADFEDLRKEGAKFITKMDFDGFGIGGDIGESKDESRKILRWVIPLLDQKRPRHLLGMGHVEDIELIMKGGVDTFDCTVPTHYARRGIAFVSKRSGMRGGLHEGRVDFTKAALLKDKNPIDAECECMVCQKYQRAYIAHLIRANEITGGALLTFHNLFFFNAYVEKMRQKIAKGLM
jgi:queuine tRNA-ribosyltransferase/7-cyano-7-deazaguanine tRNA-ribosyltransferase